MLAVAVEEPAGYPLARCYGALGHGVHRGRRRGKTSSSDLQRPRIAAEGGRLLLAARCQRRQTGYIHPYRIAHEDDPKAGSVGSYR